MSRKDEFKAKDKKVNKMTRDGVVEINKNTGEVENLSQRGKEFELRKEKRAKTKVSSSEVHTRKRQKQRPVVQADEGIGDTWKRGIFTEEYSIDTPTEIKGNLSSVKPAANSEKQHSTKYQQKFIKENEAQSGTETKPETSKLQFSADEKTPVSVSEKLTHSRRKAERADLKLENARKKLPTQKRLSSSPVYNEKKGKTTRKLHFEKEVKSQRSHLKGAVPLRPAKKGANLIVGYGHKKIYEVQHENVGVEAAHKGEIAAESVARSVYRFNKTRPYRRVNKMEQAAKKAHLQFDYKKALNDNPKLQSNPFSRYMQKRKIKQQYKKAAKEAKKAASRTKKAGDMAVSGAKAITGFVRRHPVGVSIFLLCLLLVFFIMTMFSSCSTMASGSLSSVLVSSYLADDKEINNAELIYTQWETEIQLKAHNAENTHPGYDEYRYNIADVSHNPFELMGYLTARYQDFTVGQIEADLQNIFNEQYNLTFTPQIEIRTRMVTKSRPVYDELTGAYLGMEEYEEDEEYEWHVLHVNLLSHPFSSLVTSRLSADETELYNIYLQTKGNRQYTLSPFKFDWLDYVSCYFGYRIHPISGNEDNHKAIDIAVAEGTEIVAAHDGVITTAASHSSYGLYIVLEGITPIDSSITTKYAHCSQLLVGPGQQVKAGDVIAKVGNTGDSTGAHLHFEIIVDSEYLNPIFFAEGANGSFAPGTPGGIEFPDYPGEAMGDGSFAALMEEAQKHIGKPYVFGASGPEVFDCSGFVCWSLNKSGAANVGRTTAQGLYNMSTPVSRANAQPGDLIFFTGTYSTPNAVSHVGIYIGNGQMLHCGDPIGYASIDTSYWQNHFYAFGRI